MDGRVGGHPLPRKVVPGAFGRCRATFAGVVFSYDFRLLCFFKKERPPTLWRTFFLSSDIVFGDHVIVERLQLGAAEPLHAVLDDADELVAPPVGVAAEPCVNLWPHFLSFSRSRISVSSFSSVVGSGAGAGAAGSSAFLRDSLLMPLTSRKTQKATMRKSSRFCRNSP